MNSHCATAITNHILHFSDALWSRNLKNSHMSGKWFLNHCCSWSHFGFPVQTLERRKNGFWNLCKALYHHYNNFLWQKTPGGRVANPFLIDHNHCQQVVHTTWFSLNYFFNRVCICKLCLPTKDGISFAFSCDLLERMQLFWSETGDSNVFGQHEIYCWHVWLWQQSTHTKNWATLKCFEIDYDFFLQKSCETRQFLLD